jgi:hypothetical protein
VRSAESAAIPDEGTAHDQPEAIDLTAPINGIEAAIRDLITEENEAETQRRKDQETRDLDAQEEMAKWAYWMFMATCATVLVTGAGLYLIWRTLHHTKVAAKHTEGMLEEAKATTKASLIAAKATEEANAQAANFAELETRAYLVAGDVTLHTHDIANCIFVRFSIRNVGRSPAYNIIAVRYAIHDDGTVGGHFYGKIPEGAPEFPHIATLVPGAVEWCQFPVFLDQTFSSNLISRPGRALNHIEAMVAYQTVHDRVRRRFSGEIAMSIPVDEDVIEEAALTGHDVEFFSASHRPAWMDGYLKHMKDTYDQRVFEGYQSEVES